MAADGPWFNICAQPYSLLGMMRNKEDDQDSGHYPGNIKAQLSCSAMLSKASVL